MHKREITRIVKKKQFIKKTIGCQNQIFFLLLVINVKTRKTQQCFMKTQCKSKSWEFKDSNYEI